MEQCDTPKQAHLNTCVKILIVMCWNTVTLWLLADIKRKQAANLLYLPEEFNSFTTLYS